MSLSVIILLVLYTHFKGVISRNSPPTLKTLPPDKFFGNCVFELKKNIFLGLELKKSGFVVAKWYQDVTKSARRFFDL